MKEMLQFLFHANKSPTMQKSEINECSKAECESRPNPPRASTTASFMTLIVMLNLNLITCGFVVPACNTFRAITKPRLLPAFVFACFTNVEAVEYAGGPDQEFVTAFEDESDCDAHDKRKYRTVLDVVLTVERNFVLKQVSR